MTVPSVRSEAEAGAAANPDTVGRPEQDTLKNSCTLWCASLYILQSTFQSTPYTYLSR
jgi:hypothetical protein